jgi:hypothetical protein
MKIGETYERDGVRRTIDDIQTYDVSRTYPGEPIGAMPGSYVRYTTKIGPNNYAAASSWNEWAAEATLVTNDGEDDGN